MVPAMKAKLLEDSWPTHYRYKVFMNDTFIGIAWKIHRGESPWQAELQPFFKANLPTVRDAVRALIDNAQRRSFI